MGIVEQYLLQLNTEKRRLRRVATVLLTLSLVVVFAVSWNLRLTGITMANDACCGYGEHQHDDSCPAETVAVCGFSGDAEPSETQLDAEPAELTEAVPEEHTHTEECYQTTYLCGYEEHFHVLACYSDLSADVETAQIWEAGLPGLTGQWAENLVRVARSQLGCAESERNFQISDDGQTRNGITRYGQWYGNPYGDWSSMFVMFCLDYAQIPQEAIPWSPGVQNMMFMAQAEGILCPPDDSIGVTGNILFLDTDGNGNADKSLIVTAATPDTLTAIGGDWENAVREVSISPNDSAVLGYIHVAANQPHSQETEATQPPEETTEAIETPQDPDAPQITLVVEFLEESEMMCLVAQTANIEESMFYWQWQISEDGNEPWTDIEGAEGLTYTVEATEENAVKYYRLQGRRMEQRQMTFALSRGITVTDEESGTITSGAVSPFSINKNNNVYTIDVYALPVDENGNRLSDVAVTDLGSFSVSNDTKIAVQNQFDEALGTYHSAYFGTETSVEVDDIAYVWRYRRNSYSTAYLAYQRTGNGGSNNQWLNSANSRISLYLRYIPEFTVTFASDGFNPMQEDVPYKNFPTLTEPGTWTREGYTLVGWIIDGNEQTVYTYEELLRRPVVADVTYRAVWRAFVTVRFDLGEYADALYPIPEETVAYGGALSPMPAPAWKNNTVAMAFDGWYLDQNYEEPVTETYLFRQDTTLYAKWTAKEDGFYVYFMDFHREEEVPLVLITSSVTENKTVSPFTPSNAPVGMDWDGKWYLDKECTKVYDFRIPVSQMTEYLTGASGRDLYLYPGMQAVCRAIFVTYGTKIDPVTVSLGGTINLDQYIPERSGYTFAGWTLKDGTPVSGAHVLNETTTFYATWEAGYVPFSAVARVENANDTDMSQVEILGTWYAKAGSQIVVKSNYTGSGNNRTGTHTVVCVLDGVEYPVYSNTALTRQATLADVYANYFIYNNAGTTWTDEVNWDDIYTGGELPYSVRPISSNGDTIINFDYMRARTDIVFTISNTTSGAYIDVYKLYKNGLITGSVTYTSTKPTKEGSNVSATGVSGTNVKWTYTAASGTTGNNTYTLHDMKYGQRVYEVYPVGGSWLTLRGSRPFRYYTTGTGQYFASRREDASSDFFTGTGRKLTATSFTATFETKSKVALMYAVECLVGETPDFTLNGIGYKVQTQLCEVVNSDTDFSAKDLLGCTNVGENSYTRLNSTNSSIGGTSVRTLFGTTYWSYYDAYSGVDSLSSISRAYIFHYNRFKMGVQFNFAYDADGDGSTETVEYDNIAFSESIENYQFGAPGFEHHSLLEREGYVFSGWLDANGNILKPEDWAEMVATGESEESSMIFIAKWEKISNNIVEYYEDVSAQEPFESHYFEDGAFLEYPTMVAYPQGWVWQEQGEGSYVRFDWDVPMYGEDGVQEVRQINGEERTVNVIRIYGRWDESHTKVVYDPNAAQGGVPGSAPVDSNEYTIWQSEVSVMSQSGMTNADPDMVFAGWLLDRNGVVYQPGDHVAVHWPRTMIFTAQWAKAEEIVSLRYHPNGGTPQDCYPNDTGYHYRKNATAIVWDNKMPDGTVWYQRIGYTFTGWNTQPDGSGEAYSPDANIQLTDPLTTLYAQWSRDTFDFFLHKVDYANGRSLPGAEFDLYRLESGQFRLIESKITGTDGRIEFTDIETDILYKLVESNSPPGYALITREIFFRMTPGDAHVSFDFCNENAAVIPTPDGVSGEYISGQRMLTMTVQNVAGFELPATGGIGTPIYILCGVIFMLAPFVYGFKMRRKFERRAVK